jgi:hypothetical protein
MKDKILNRLKWSLSATTTILSSTFVLWLELQY